MRVKLPEFLNGTQLTKQDTERLEPIMANWLSAYAHIRVLQPDEAGVLELKKMLVYELQIGRRLQMIYRLRSRFNNLRAKLEDSQLFDKV